MNSKENNRFDHSSRNIGRENQWFLANEEGSSIKDASFVLCSKNGSTSQDQITLLNQIGIYPRVVAVDQDTKPRSLPPAEFVEQMSAEKAKKGAKILSQNNEPYDIIIACESVVALGDEVIGKPQDADDAFKILSRLNNRHHSILSGVTLIHKSQRIETFNVKTTVCFGEIPAEMFREYIKCGECFAHDGAYNIHGKAAYFIKSIDGDLLNANGFPVHKLIQKIREFLLQPDRSVAERFPSRATPSAQTKGPRPIPFPRTILPAPLNRVNVPAESKEENKENLSYHSFVDQSYQEFEANLFAVDQDNEEQSYAAGLVADGVRQSQHPSMPVPSSVIDENRLNTLTYDSEKVTDVASDKTVLPNASQLQRAENLHRTQLPREQVDQTSRLPPFRTIQAPPHFSRSGYVSSSLAPRDVLVQQTQAARRASETQSNLPQQHSTQDAPPPAFPKFITPGPFRPVSILTQQSIPQALPQRHMITSYPATGSAETSDLHRIDIDPKVARKETHHHDYSHQDDYGQY